MSRRVLPWLALGGLVVVAVVAALLAPHHRAVPVTRTATEPGVPSPTRSVSSAAARSPDQSAAALTAAREVAAGYATYLNGDGPAGAIRPASVTARAQAGGGGRIPPGFRDGPLRVVSLRTDATAYSARVQVVLANDEERYPLALGLLREQRGWEATEIDPPDLSMDDPSASPPPPRLPAAAEAAARAAALAYVAFRAGVGPRPAGLGAPAQSALRAGRDPLASARLPRGRPQVVSAAFGPPTAGRLAATVKLRVGTARAQVSLLMNRTAAGAWRCDAFL